jgi:hypothetical protein
MSQNVFEKYFPLPDLCPIHHPTDHKLWRDMSKDKRYKSQETVWIYLTAVQICFHCNLAFISSTKKYTLERLIGTRQFQNVFIMCPA